jgi:hypothetical protein
LKWLRGSIESYFLGRTSLNIVRGRVRKALESYGVGLDEVKQIVSSILLDPSIGVPRDVREEKAEELLKLVEGLGRGGGMVKCPYCSYEDEFKLLAD